MLFFGEAGFVVSDLFFCSCVIEGFDSVCKVFWCGDEVIEAGAFEKVCDFWAVGEGEEGNRVIDGGDDSVKAHGDNDFGFG